MHRDLESDNTLLIVKVLDFGIARFLDPVAPCAVVVKSASA